MKKPTRSKRRSKPCTACRTWFTPNPRLGARQLTCGKPACRKALKQRRQKAWTKRNPDYWAGRRLREQLDRAKELDVVAPAQPPPAHLRQIPADIVQAVMSPQAFVIISFLVRLQHRATQAALRAEVLNLKEKSTRHDPPSAQASIATSGQGP